ncbi:MAG: ribosome silencing factor [Lachnospiraceae bacterium]
MEPKQIVKIAIEAMEGKKTEDIRIIDIADISTIADYFVIASGDNIRQVKAIANEVEEQLGKNGVCAKQIEGTQSANWILMDYSDVIIHIFDKENRIFYNLERIWKDGKQINKEELF